MKNNSKNKCKIVNDITAPRPPKKNLETYFEVFFFGGSWPKWYSKKRRFCDFTKNTEGLNNAIIIFFVEIIQEVGLLWGKHKNNIIPDFKRPHFYPFFQAKVCIMFKRGEGG